MNLVKLFRHLALLFHHGVQMVEVFLVWSFTLRKFQLLWNIKHKIMLLYLHQQLNMLVKWWKKYYFIHQVLNFLNIYIVLPFQAYCHNMDAIYMTRNYARGFGTRQFNYRYHFLFQALWWFYVLKKMKLIYSLRIPQIKSLNDIHLCWFLRYPLIYYDIEGIITNNRGGVKIWHYHVTFYFLLFVIIPVFLQ